MDGFLGVASVIFFYVSKITYYYIAVAVAVAASALSAIIS
jgi:hypothetical protein